MLDDKPLVRALLRGAFVTLVAMLIAGYYFPRFLGMACTGLISLSLVFYMEKLLEYNREAIWVEKKSPWGVNLRFAGEVSCLFLGIFLVSFVLLVQFPDFFPLALEKSETNYLNETLTPLFISNIKILLGGFVFSVLYRAGGLMIILSWNALLWAKTILFLIYEMLTIKSLYVAVLYMLTILPHLVCEVYSYILAGMAGIFISKAVMKYKLKSFEFLRVSRACVVIILISIVALFLSANIEIYFAQPIIRMLYTP